MTARRAASSDKARAAAGPSTDGAAARATVQEQVAGLTENVANVREQQGRDHQQFSARDPLLDKIMERLDALGSENATSREAIHGIRGNQQMRMAEDMRNGKHETPRPTIQQIGAVVAVVFTVVGATYTLVNMYANRQVGSSALEARVEANTRELLTASTAMPRLTALENRVNTVTTIRDQQQQMTADRLRALEQTDTVSAEKMNMLLNSLAGFTARMEEMLRRQERLENRLSMPGLRPNRDDEERPIILPRYDMRS